MTAERPNKPAVDVESLVAELYPGGAIDRVVPLGADHDKATGYGKPVRISLRKASGERRELVLHTAVADQYGHDRRSDRADEWLLAYDSFGKIPRHVAPVDVGFVAPDGTLHSVRDSGEFYLLTEFAPGELYADDLRSAASRRRIDDRDRKRCGLLAGYLAELHDRRIAAPSLYRRAIRDLVGHGEGIFGLIDAFPDDVPAAPPSRLRSIEKRCVDWRWRLRRSESRLALTHGDFHPFNILFDDDDQLAVLDASRGCRGDPADDVVCLGLNYMFFAVDHPGAWDGGLGELWRQFVSCYTSESGDDEWCEVAPPFVAWRALVMAHPGWYPNVSAESRDMLLTIVEQALDNGFFDPVAVSVAMRGR